MVIRTARRADAPALVPLYAQWQHPQSAEVIEAVLAAWEGRDDRVFLVAADDENAALAGFVAVSAAPHVSRPGCYARLTGLAVSAAHRRAGIGGALVAAAEDRARAWGCDHIELTSSRARDAAHFFYPARGYEDASSHHARYVKRL